MPTRPSRPCVALARRVLTLAAVAAGLAPRTVAAQNVTEVQIAPPQVVLKVGARSVVSATLFSAQGDILSGRRVRWSSANVEIARIEYDTLHSDVATVVGVGTGFVLIEARVGTTSSSATVQVDAAELPVITPPPVIQPPVTQPVTAPAGPPALPDTSFAPGAADQVLRSAVRIEAYRFNTPATCANGSIVGNGLVLTSYNAIVGADSVIVTLASGIRVSNGRVASYDIANDLSMLSISAGTTDTLLAGSDGSQGQNVWLAGSTDCTSPRSQRTRIASRDIGSAQLDETGRGWDGAAVVGQHGELVGLAHVGGRTTPASAVGEAIRRARSAALTGSALTVTQVARRENQSFGTVVIRSDLASSAARLTPLERWQPSSAGQTGSIPFTFTAPMGRYRAELMVTGLLRATDTLLVAPGQTTNATLNPPSVLTPAPTPVTQAPPPQQPPGAQPPANQPEVHSGGGFPWPVLLLVGAGGGAAALLLGKKSGGGGTPTGSGTITISLPKAQ